MKAPKELRCKLEPITENGVTVWECKFCHTFTPVKKGNAGNFCKEKIRVLTNAICSVQTKSYAKG